MIEQKDLDAISQLLKGTLNGTYLHRVVNSLCSYFNTEYGLDTTDFRANCFELDSPPQREVPEEAPPTSTQPTGPAIDDKYGFKEAIKKLPELINKG